VDKIVTLTHGKAEQAGRDKWNAVARARHNRQKNHASEPALDLLERYLEHGKNLTPQEAERWGGKYPLTILEEAIKRLAPRFGVASSRELADQYPKTVKHKPALENILRDVGVEYLDFKNIRDTDKDFAQAYGIPAAPTSTTGSAAASSSGSASSAGTTTGALLD